MTDQMAVPDATRDALWWEGKQEYWDLPFYAEMGMCCEAMLKRDDELAAREQLWAIRELGLEPGEDGLFDGAQFFNGVCHPHPIVVKLKRPYGDEIR